MHLVYTQIGFIDIYTGYLHYGIHVHTTLYIFRPRVQKNMKQVETLYK